MPIPPLQINGYLPEGVHVCGEEELFNRFGRSSPRRKRLCNRIKRWIELGRAVGARRLLIDGSFVSAKVEPEDVDAVLQIDDNFDRLLDEGQEAALELLEMLETRQPEEVFAAEDNADWNDWLAFFSRTRGSGRIRKGLVEIPL